MVKQCQLCDERFGCAEGQPGCWCESVALRADTLARLRAIADDCLCPACLSGYAAAESDEAGGDGNRRRLVSAKAIPDAAVKARGLPPLWALGALLFLLVALLVALATGPI